MSARDTNGWNTRSIRQAARVLGTQSSWVGDIQGIARAQRLVRDMLERRGVATEMFHVPGTMPLVIAGSGPHLLVTFLDDSNPSAEHHGGNPPDIRDALAVAPGMIRKAGVLAAIGSVAGANGAAAGFTLAVEADRHNGSRALEQWLDRSGRRFSGALCETVDLPIPAPLVYPAAMGRLSVELRIDRAVGQIDDAYAGVVDDLGFQIAEIITSLKSAASEVKLPEFYDAVLPPTPTDVAFLEHAATPIGAWLRRQGVVSHDVSDRHRAMAVFFAPGITVRQIGLTPNAPFLPTQVSATIDIALVPGQHPPTILRSIQERVHECAPHCVVQQVYGVPPVAGQLRGRIDSIPGVPIGPIAPGISPAGYLEERGIPTASYSVVERTPAIEEESIDLSRIAEGTTTIGTILDAIATK